MAQRSYRLAVEELAYLLTLLGGAEAGGGFLAALFGDLSPDNLDGRLTSAGHSLFARGLLDYRESSDEVYVEPDVERLVGAMVRPDFLFRCSRAHDGEEVLLNAFVAGDIIASQQLVRKMAVQLESVTTSADLVEHSREFFDLREVLIAGDSASCGTIPAEALNLAKETSGTASLRETAARLVAGGLDRAVADDLATDLAQPRYRGSILRVEQPNTAPTADRGVLLLRGPRRCWLFPVVPADPGQLRVFPGSLDRYSQLVTSLLGS